MLNKTILKKWPQSNTSHQDRERGKKGFKKKNPINQYPQGCDNLGATSNVFQYFRKLTKETKDQVFLFSFPGPHLS